MDLTKQEKKAILTIGKLINDFSSNVALHSHSKGELPDIIEITEKVYTTIKDQILSAMGVCPECKGEKVVPLDNCADNLGTCLKCHGTGTSPLVEQEIREEVRKEIADKFNAWVENSGDYDSPEYNTLADALSGKES